MATATAHVESQDKSNSVVASDQIQDPLVGFTKQDGLDTAYGADQFLRSRIPQKGVEATTPEREHGEFISGVVNTLNPQHPVTAEAVTPVTSETPIAQTPELQNVGAQVVGGHEFTLNEDVGSKKRDLAHWIKGLIGRVFGGHTEKREGPLGRLWNKMRRKKEVQVTKAAPNAPSEDIE